MHIVGSGSGGPRFLTRRYEPSIRTGLETMVREDLKRLVGKLNVGYRPTALFPDEWSLGKDPSQLTVLESRRAAPNGGISEAAEYVEWISAAEPLWLENNETRVAVSRTISIAVVTDVGHEEQQHLPFADRAVHESISTVRSRKVDSRSPQKFVFRLGAPTILPPRAMG